MRTLVLLLISSVLVQCVSKSVSDEALSDVGLWAGKVQMTNRTTKQRKWVNVTWASDSLQDRMRIDVTAILDIPVATYIKNSEGFHLWVFTERKYYSSQSGKNLFKFLTKLSLDPDIFYSMLGQPRSPSSSWSCQDVKKKVLSCNEVSGATRFSVEYPSSQKRTIHINKGVKALRIRLSKSKAQLRDELFESLSTSHFKTIKI